jgi:hypothetical protein
VRYRRCGVGRRPVRDFTHRMLTISRPVRTALGITAERAPACDVGNVTRDVEFIVPRGCPRRRGGRIVEAWRVGEDPEISPVARIPIQMNERHRANRRRPARPA